MQNLQSFILLSYLPHIYNSISFNVFLKNHIAKCCTSTKFYKYLTKEDRLPWTMYVVMMQKQRKKRMMEEDEVRSFPLILDWHDFYEPNGNDDVLVPRQMESGYMEKITLIVCPLAYPYLYIKDTFFQLFYQFWKKNLNKTGSELGLICNSIIWNRINKCAI